MSLRFVALLIISTMMLTAGFASQRAGSSQAPACQPVSSLRTVHLSVPANRTVTFPLVEFDPVAGLSPRTSQPVLGFTRPDGSLRTATANHSHSGDAWISPSGLTFAPAQGYIGVSTGWVLAFNAGAPSSLASFSECADGIGSTNANAVLLTFEVRNTLPVAIDDAVIMPGVASLMDVGPASGVLANDLDWNSDPLVVHTTGTTEFPWGTVDLEADGSYRIVVTNPDAVAPATLRYVVWDQQGSPTSVDTGYLTIDFTLAES